MFGDEAVFDHVGLAVRSIDSVGAAGLQPVNDPKQSVNVAFVDLHGLKIELVEPAGENNPVSASLERGQKLLHLCFRVPDLERAIEEARHWGFHCIWKPVPAIAFENRPIVWLFSQVYGLVELVEI